MLSVLYGLGSAVAYGAADFFGGLASRRTEPVAVVLYSQALTIPLLALVVPIVGGELSRTALAWGSAAGVLGGAGVIFLYRGLGRAAMSTVAPITAIEAAGVPVVFGLFTGERPGAQRLIGVVVALIAVAFISATGGEGGRFRMGPGVTDALVAGACFGGFFLTLDQTPPDSAMWPLVGVRAGSLVVVGVAVAITRRRPKVPRPTWGYVALAGTLDVTANVLFVLSTRAGLLSIAAVLTSLYPAVTVLLARVWLGERLTPLQALGVVLGAAGVVLIAV